MSFGLSKNEIRNILKKEINSGNGISADKLVEVISDAIDKNNKKINEDIKN